MVVFGELRGGGAHDVVVNVPLPGRGWSDLSAHSPESLDDLALRRKSWEGDSGPEALDLESDVPFVLLFPYCKVADLNGSAYLYSGVPCVGSPSILFLSHSLFPPSFWINHLAGLVGNAEDAKAALLNKPAGSFWALLKGAGARRAPKYAITG